MGLCSWLKGKRAGNEKNNCMQCYQSGLSENLPVLKSCSAIKETMQETGKGTVLSAKLIKVQNLIQNPFIWITSKYPEQR